MAGNIEIPITSEGVLSLKQSCQTIIDAYKRHASSNLIKDENGIYPTLLSQVRGLKTDVEAGINSLNDYQNLTLDGIKRPKKGFGDISNYSEIQDITGNYPISQSLYDEAEQEASELFDGMKHRKSTVLEDGNSSSFVSDRTSENTEIRKSSPRIKPEAIGQENLSPLSSATYTNTNKNKFLNTLQEECIPCDSRLNNLNNFLPDLKALAPWEELEKRYKEIANRLKSLLNNTDIAEDICSLLNFLDFHCVPDLYSLIALLSALMRKYADLMPGLSGAFMNFIGPFFSPLLGGLNGLLDKYIQMILRPIDCVIGSLDTQLAKLDVQRALKQSDVANLSFHRNREEKMLNRIDQLKDRKVFLEGEIKKGEDPNSSPPQKIGDSKVSLPLVKTISEEIQTIDQDITNLESKYQSEYGAAGSNNIAKLEKESNVPTKSAITDSTGGLKDVRSGLSSSLYELRNQALNGRRMINDTMRLMREELNRLIHGRAETSSELISGASNIQKVARLIGVVTTIIKLANKGKLCENSNGDPSIALGSFLTASSGGLQRDNYFNVFIGDNESGDKSLLIAPSSAVLKLSDTEGVAQLDNLGEIRKLNREGIPKDIGNIADKKVTATVPDLGVEVPVSIISFDLCSNSDFSTKSNIDDIMAWAENSGLDK